MRLYTRIEILEDRIRRLEMRAPARPPVRPAAKGAKAKPPGAEAPRCPGCYLELPAGPRGESCVWCDFRFAALRRPRVAPRRKKKGARA